MNVLPKILICDDDTTFQIAVKFALKNHFNCYSAHNGDECLTILKNQRVDIILLDLHMRTPLEGLDVIPKISELEPSATIIMISGNTDFEIVKKALKLGASDYIPKNFEPNDLIHTIRLGLERNRLLQSESQHKFETKANSKKYEIVGNSKELQTLKSKVERIKKTQFNVVIFGETGTGKELVARQLRKNRPCGTPEPFIAIDSSTIQASTAESILFGHEKGAFTGADSCKKGLFEEASDGVVYFDEIANMPINIQTKLLRVLQEKEISRLGSHKVIELNFRVIAATNKNLDQLVSEGKFLPDLYQRLNVLPLKIPPLGDRLEDLEPLIAHFIKKSGVKRNLKISLEALNCLKSYSWPGNIRELENLINYVITMSESDYIEIKDLPQKITKFSDLSPAPVQQEHTFKPTPLYEATKTFEKNFLTLAYRHYSGNVSKLSRELKIDRSHVYTKLKEFNIYNPQNLKL